MKIQIDGLKELEVALKAISDEVGGKDNKILTSALWSAALPVEKDAKARVPVEEGDLQRSIKRRRVNKPKAYTALVTVGVPMPEWETGQHAKLINKEQGGHGLFVEFGTKLPWSGGNKRGSTRADYRSAPLSSGNVMMPPRPFLRPALESNQQGSTEIFKNKAGAGIEKAANAIGRKTK